MSEYEKLTGKKIMEWFGEDDSTYKAWNHLWSKEFNDAARKEVRRLIEQGAKVDKEFVEKWKRKFNDKIHEGNITFEWEPGSLIEEMFTEVGVKVEEKEKKQ